MLLHNSLLDLLAITQHVHFATTEAGQKITVGFSLLLHYMQVNAECPESCFWDTALLIFAIQI